MFNILEKLKRNKESLSHKELLTPNGRGINNGVRKDRTRHMLLSSVLFIGYRNILINRTRSILTISGVAIGIGIITLLISLGFGIQGMVIREVTKSNPSDIIDVSNKSLENFSLLDEAAMEKIKNIDGVKSMEINSSVGGKISNGESQTDVVIFAVSKGYLDLAKINLLYGKKEDIYNMPESVIITPKVASLLGFSSPEESIGKDVDYSAAVTDEMLGAISKTEQQTPTTDSENILHIVGIVNDPSQSDGVYAYMFIEELREKYGNVAGSSAKILTLGEDKVNNIRSQIEQMGFVTESVVDTITDINSFFSVVRIILVVFGVIIMSISAMGMLNTLSVSLLQRTKEIGILKALGSKRIDVFKMFIFEAFLISFTGGLLGLLGGYGIARALNYIVNIFAAKYGVVGTSFIEMPNMFVISITIFIFFLGLFTGLFPASRASKIHALEALRYE
jgi:putative ABC transport system permease protein